MPFDSSDSSSPLPFDSSDSSSSLSPVGVAVGVGMGDGVRKGVGLGVGCPWDVNDIVTVSGLFSGEFSPSTQVG